VRVPELNWPKDLYADAPSRWAGKSSEGDCLWALPSYPVGDAAPWFTDLDHARRPDELVVA
jgi:hypothetical protein